MLVKVAFKAAAAGEFAATARRDPPDLQLGRRIDGARIHHPGH